MVNEEIDYSQLKVDKENNIVSYNDELHKYWTKDLNKSCISVTTLIHKFQNFDESFWARYKALQSLVGEDEFDGPVIGKNKRGPASDAKKELLDTKKYDHKWSVYYGYSAEEVETRTEEILAKWAEKRETSCIRGTNIHKQFELGHLAEDTKELSYLKLGGSFKTDTSNDIQPGQKVYPELLLSRISDDGKLRVAGQADLVIVDGFDVYILDYKGLPLDTPILTIDGFKLLKDLTKKDIIFDKDGNQTKILNISEIHNNPCYTIEFDNGENITCDHEHRWLISFRRGTGKYKEMVMTTEELEQSFLKYQKSKNSYDLPKIMNAKPLNIEKKNLPLDPYIFGAWLGDGTSATGSITNVNPAFWEEVKKRGYDYGDNIGGEGKAEQRTIFNIRGILNDLGVLNNKHLPDSYLLSSYEQRLDILRGIMDTDGYYNSTRKRFVMTTTREWQVECMVKLLGSLGVKSSVIYAKKYCNGKVFDGWDVCFTMSQNPFLIRNQEGIEYPKTDKASFRGLKAIYKINTVETQCLEVDSPSHTFLVGHSLLPTHNTNEKIDTKSYFDTKLKKSQKLKYPLNDIDDCNFMHYTLQLSTYAWMIQKIDPRFNIKSLTLIHIDHDNNVNYYECEYIPKKVELMLAYHKKQLENEEFKAARKKIIF